MCVPQKHTDREVVGGSIFRARPLIIVSHILSMNMDSTFLATRNPTHPSLPRHDLILFPLAVQSPGHAQRAAPGGDDVAYAGQLCCVSGYACSRQQEARPPLNSPGTSAAVAWFPRPATLAS
eukprot:366551-Chlamydomonas_euryale.AAC.11